jgi:hypothetical protein
LLRRLFLDWPAKLTEVLLVWYRLYFALLLVLAAATLPAMVLAMLVLWFGFGIRWGW